MKRIEQDALNILLSRRAYLVFLDGRVCERALPATLLEFSLYRLSVRILEAFDATAVLVCFGLFFAIESPPY